jgi:hypothetical protein
MTRVMSSRARRSWDHLGGQLSRAQLERLGEILPAHPRPETRDGRRRGASHAAADHEPEALAAAEEAEDLAAGSGQDRAHQSLADVRRHSGGSTSSVMR